jgi:hypothetical protein
MGDRPGNTFKLFYDLGYKTLLSITPPNAPLVMTDAMRDRLAAGGDPRGKLPGKRGDDGLWFGFKGWSQYMATPADLDNWHAMGAGVGLRTDDGLLAIDADTLVPEWAKVIEETIEAHIGKLPKRIGNAPKALYLCRLDNGVNPFRYGHFRFGELNDKGQPKELCEFLGTGQQFVAHGIHQKTGKPYDWTRELVAFDDLPVINREQFDALFADLQSKLPNANAGRSGSGADVDQMSLVGDLELVLTAIKAIPNTSAAFPTRRSYLDVGYAVKAALPDDPQEALEAYLGWCDSWADGENDLGVAAADFDRMVGPYRIGAGWLYDQAAKHGDGTFNPAAQWFDTIEETENPFAQQAQATAAADTAEKHHRRLTIEYFADIGIGYERPTPLVKGLLSQGAMSVLYGDSNVGKSFVAMDLGFHIAAGLTYCGMKTTQGPVVYVAAEGGIGARDRIAALKIKFPEYATNRDFMLIASSVDLRRPDADTVRLVETIRDTGKKPILLVIDTLSRAMSGGDENSPVDMGALVKNLDLIRAALAPLHLMVIHHTGKDAAKGARGHSLLRAATDTEIEVAEGVAGRAIAVTKQRDLDKSWTSGFALEVHTLDIDEDGEPVSSCTVRMLSQGESAAAKVAVTAGEQAVLDGLQSLLGTPETDEEAAKLEAGGVKTADIVTFMADISSGKSTADAVRGALKRLHGKGLLTHPKHGHWAFSKKEDKASVSECVSQCVKDIFE